MLAGSVMFANCHRCPIFFPDNSCESSTYFSWHSKKICMNLGLSSRTWMFVVRTWMCWANEVSSKFLEQVLEDFAFSFFSSPWFSKITLLIWTKLGLKEIRWLDFCLLKDLFDNHGSVFCSEGCYIFLQTCCLHASLSCVILSPWTNNLPLSLSLPYRKKCCPNHTKAQKRRRPRKRKMESWRKRPSPQPKPKSQRNQKSRMKRRITSRW